MKHILLFEAYTTLDQDLTQRVEFKDKMLKDYKLFFESLKVLNRSFNPFL